MSLPCRTMYAACLLLHHKLIVGNDVSCLHEGFCLLQTEVDVEEHLLALHLR